MDLSIVFGLLLLLAGVFLVGFGISSTQRWTDKVVQGVTGRYTQNTMWYLIGGALLILLGSFLIYSGWQGPVLPPS